MNLRATARQFGLGRAAYALWHAPIGAVKRSLAAGGPLEQWRNQRGAAAMESAAVALPTARGAAAPDLPELHFLTGRKFWYQTAFCLHTLQVQSGCVFRAVFHDDGSCDDATRGRLATLFPAASIRLRLENDAHIAGLLPPAHFPTLHRERQRSYPNFLKLTDVHAGRAGWRLVLDSDMLFFRRPERLLDWLTAPTRPIAMLDVGDAYGYPLEAMSELAGASVPPRINVGFCGLESGHIDWSRVEFWARTLTERYGLSYYLEQALSAMLFAGHQALVLPPDDYRLMPDVHESRAPSAVMHHYVGPSKRGYFRHGWRAALELSGPGVPAS